ncbi:hypothetical protein FKP32DRAFT_1577497 [Trametes sanguinea]|nr:hypothetical protein FKP32DRAFT_1577497 [Trametes sanguinea]
MSTSSIPRSHSVPHVGSLKITTTDLPRPRPKLPRHRSALPLSGSSTSSFSALYTPRTEREDPFSLGGFFPANLSTFEKSPTEQEWDWLHPDAAAADEDYYDDDRGRGRYFSPVRSGLVSPISEDEEWDIPTPCSALADADDSLARDAIQREDKLGILTLTDKLSLASHGDEAGVEDGRLLSPYTQTGDPLADEAVYDALRALRTAHSRPRGSGGKGSKGEDEAWRVPELFCPEKEGDDKVEAGGWEALVSWGVSRVVDYFSPV